MNVILEDYPDRLWMWLRREIRWRWLSGILLLLSAWFAWHALHGPRGFYAYMDERRSVQVLEQNLAGLEVHEKALKQHQRLLDRRAMDADLVEEKLLQLGWIHKGDIFIPDEKSGSSNDR